MDVLTADLLTLHLNKKPTEVLKEEALKLDPTGFLELTEKYAGKYGTFWASVRYIKRRTAVDIDRSIIRSGDRWLVDVVNNIIYDLEKKLSTIQIILDGNIVPMKDLDLNFTYDNKYLLYKNGNEVLSHQLSDLPVILDSRNDRKVGNVDRPIINIQGKYFIFMFIHSFKVKYYNNDNYNTRISMFLSEVLIKHYYMVLSKVNSWPWGSNILSLPHILERLATSYGNLRSIDQLQFSPDNKWIFFAYTRDNGKLYFGVYNTTNNELVTLLEIIRPITGIEWHGNSNFLIRLGGDIIVYNVNNINSSMFISDNQGEYSIFNLVNGRIERYLTLKDSTGALKVERIYDNGYVIHLTKNMSSNPIIYLERVDGLRFYSSSAESAIFLDLDRNQIKGFVKESVSGKIIKTWSGWLYLIRSHMLIYNERTGALLRFGFSNIASYISPQQYRISMDAFYRAVTVGLPQLGAGPAESVAGPSGSAEPVAGPTEPGSPWYETCSNTIDLISQESWQDLSNLENYQEDLSFSEGTVVSPLELPLKPVKIYFPFTRINQETGQPETRYDIYCANRLELYKYALSVPMANWVPRSPGGTIDNEGYGGKPGNEKYYKLYTQYYISNPDILTKNPSLNFEAKVLKGGQKIRIGNAKGSFGVSQTHGQIDLASQVYQLVPRAPETREILPYDEQLNQAEQSYVNRVKQLSSQVFISLIQQATKDKNDYMLRLLEMTGRMVEYEAYRQKLEELFIWISQHSYREYPSIDKLLELRHLDLSGSQIKTIPSPEVYTA